MTRAKQWSRISDKLEPDVYANPNSGALGICDDILQVTQLPMIYNCNSGQQPEVFHFTVRWLERLGVSMCVVDKPTLCVRGAKYVDDNPKLPRIVDDAMSLKFNHLMAQDPQLADLVSFQEKIATGRDAKTTEDFSVIARVEAFHTAGPRAAVRVAEAALQAGADGVMIQSDTRSLDEVVEFLRAYAKLPQRKMAVCVPPAGITDKELHAEGVSVIIHPSQLMRAAYPAMKGVAEGILSPGRSRELDKELMPAEEMVSLVPDRPCGPEQIDPDAEQDPVHHRVLHNYSRHKHKET